MTADNGKVVVSAKIPGLGTVQGGRIVNPQLNQAELALYDSDPFCWGVYTTISKADGSINQSPEEAKRALWDLLDDKQKDELRTLARMKQ